MNTKHKKNTAKLAGFIVVFSAFLLITHTAHAAIYYVDATNGNDSNNGTSQSTSWKTLAKVGKASLQPGDSVLLKKGEIWREQLTMQSGGNSSAPITIGAYGTGNNPIISGATKISAGDTGWLSAGTNLYQITKSSGIGAPYSSYTNGSALGIGWRGAINDNPPATSGRMRMISTPTKDLDFYASNSTTEKVYSTTDPKNYDWQFANIQYGISSIYGYLVIDSIDFQLQSYASINLTPTAKHITIKNCSFYGSGFQAVATSGQYTTISSCKSIFSGDTAFYLNHIDDTGEGGASDSIIENCTIKYSANYESNWDRGSIGVQQNRCIIRNNYIEGSGPDTNQADQYGDAAIGLYHSQDCLIEKNTIVNSSRYGIYFPPYGNIARYNLIVNWDQATVATGGIESGIALMPYFNNNTSSAYWTAKIYNNTFVSTKAGLDNAQAISLSNPDAEGISATTYYGLEIADNIFYMNNGRSDSQAIWSGNGSYKDTTEATPTKTFTGNNDYWVNNSGSQKSDPTDLGVDPKFVSSSDFHLQSTSPLIDKGRSMGATADIAGTSVPQGSAPDVGAYEYTSGSTPPPPPPPPVAVTGDLNGDSVVNATDFGIIKNDFLKLTANLVNPKSDIDADGQVTIKDVGMLMSGWR